MIQEEMDKRSIKYTALAPTNKAAKIISGKTIHKFASAYTNNTIKKLNIEYIFVDEISMIQSIFYKFMLVVKKLKI